MSMSSFERLRRRIPLLLAPSFLASSLGLAAPASGEILASDVLPLSPGFFWDYDDGFTNVRALVLELESPPSVVPSFPIAFTGGVLSGSRQNYTNDELGLRLHGSTEATASTLETITLFPPIVVLPAEFDVGDRIESEGEAFVTIESPTGVNHFSVNYLSVNDVRGFEDLAVPLGDFRALRIDTSLDFFEPGGASLLSEGTEWFALGIGTIRDHEITTLDGSFVSSLSLAITATNVPEPRRILMELLALFVLGVGVVSRHARFRFNLQTAVTAPTA